MKKTLVLILSLLFISSSAFLVANAETKGPFGYSLNDDINRAPNETPFAKNNNENSDTNNDNVGQQTTVNLSNGNNEWESATSYYPNATMGSAITKYKRGNYSGALQEFISLSKKDPYNPLLLYYLGMTYTQVGNKQQAINAYEAVINLNSNPTLTTYATKGRDCLSNGPTCHEDEIIIENDLDRFINAPYGNGLSDELNQQMKEQRLRTIEKRIRAKDILEDTDVEDIQKFDQKSNADDINQEKLAMADDSSVSNEDVLSAIETLKKAGVTVSINPYQTQMPMNDEYAQLSMMLGNNNYNNNNSMMNMLPMLMTQNKGQIDPQVIQSMMMNSMLPDFTFNDKKDY